MANMPNDFDPTAISSEADDLIGDLCNEIDSHIQYGMPQMPRGPWGVAEYLILAEAYHRLEQEARALAIEAATIRVKGNRESDIADGAGA